MSAAPARSTALRVVSVVRTRDAWVRPVLDTELRKAGLDERDASLARALAIGVVEMGGSLDAAIDRYARSPGSIEPRVRDALRLASYEILFMRTPSHVAVHQGVDLVRSVTPRAAGLANAILRRLAENADTFPWVPTDTPEGRALATGHPAWLAQRLVVDLGQDDAFELLDSDNTPAPVYLGVDLLRGAYDRLLDDLAKLGGDPHEVDPPGCIRIGTPSAVLNSHVIDDGIAFVSDAAAQQVAQLSVGPSGGRIVEIGAGRGTKTLAMLTHALRLDVPLEIDAVDISSAKLEVLAQRAGLQDVDRVRTHTIDVLGETLTTSALRGADSVLLDAPCSNVGTLRRHPERRWSLTPEDVTARARAAQSMLAASAQLVRPGGFVLYSTCSVLAEENRKVTAAFLDSADGSGFVVESLADDVSPGFAPWVDGEGVLQTLPSVDGPDGHFAVRLRHGG